MERIDSALDVLWNEATDLCVGSEVGYLDSPPSPLEFATEYYSKSCPVVIRNAVAHWPAVHKWSPAYFAERLAGKLVDVAVTPNGYADGVATQDGTEYFVLPLEEQLTMEDFLAHLDDPMGAIYYIQKQNSNFSADFPELSDDIDRGALQFAESVFRKQPDAVNMWMGDERAITSMHKDPYDNLYCVIAGYKDFILLPPHQVPWIPRRIYPTGVYRRRLEMPQQFHIVPADPAQRLTTEWISIDPLCPDLGKYPQYAKTTPIRVRVNAGDVLYLPSLWFHHVRQSHKCVALNFWYDMEFDSRYCYFRMMQELVPAEPEAKGKEEEEQKKATGKES